MIFLYISALLLAAVFVCVVDVWQKRCIIYIMRAIDDLNVKIEKIKAEIETLECTLLRERQEDEMLLAAEQAQSERQARGSSYPCQTCGAEPDPDEDSHVVWHEH